MTLPELDALLSARSHPHLLSRRRAAATAALVRAFAILFAVLTAGWIAVDAIVFGSALWSRLAVVRIGTAALFAALAIASRPPQDTLFAARIRLAALFAIPAAFFAATQEMLLGVPRGSIAQGIAVLYSFVPFVLAAGIAAFPLVLSESAAVLLLALALQGWALDRSGAGSQAELFDAAWLLFLIAGVAILLCGPIGLFAPALAVFSLITAVLVILVIFGSLVVGLYTNVQRKAKIDAAKAQIGAFEGPLDLYQLNMGAYPGTAEGLAALRSPPRCCPVIGRAKPRLPDPPGAWRSARRPGTADRPRSGCRPLQAFARSAP